MTPQDDFSPESRLLSLPVGSLVAMRSAKTDFADPSGALLGLGSGDLFDLKLPAFQRGLKWDDERLKEFHDSLIQGWPMGVIVIAIQSSAVINSQTGQRRYALSLIDGQQRSWALSRLVDEFWSKPWFMFHSPKWDVVGPPAGSIVRAGAAAGAVAASIGCKQIDLEDAVRNVSQAKGPTCFDDYADFLEELELELDLQHAIGKASRAPARDLCDALKGQFQALCDIPVPALLLSEATQGQLPSIFRRLNEGVPLKGYDLLAAMWESAAIGTHALTTTDRKFLGEVLAVAEQRIMGTYSKLGSGYVIDPNLESLRLEDLSLFDLLHYLGTVMAGQQPFATTSDVLAFQTSALAFRGSIGKVDDGLRDAFPVGVAGEPDIRNLPKMYLAAASNVADALKPLMDVTSSNLTVRGKLGLTPSVVYLATLLTHHNVVEHKAGNHLTLRRRGNATNDRMVSAGAFLTASQRLSTLKRNLPSWYVHDALTSVFAGSRAYEAANDRVWEAFRGAGKRGAFALKPSNQMFEQPDLDSMASAFNKLWSSEMSVDRTPIRRRVSDGGSVLMRAAYSNLHVHDYVIDHVLPYAKGRSSAQAAKDVYPLNHIANLMPLESTINGQRGDQDWVDFMKTIKPSEARTVKALLMVPPKDAKAASLKNLATFTDFLRLRYRALVAVALTNLQHDGWAGLTPSEKKDFLKALANA
jgi:hypothetical protein